MFCVTIKTNDKVVVFCSLDLTTQLQNAKCWNGPFHVGTPSSDEGLLSSRGFPVSDSLRSRAPSVRASTPHHTTPRQANANATSNARVTPRHAPPHHTAPQHWKDQRWIWWDILFPSVSAYVCLAREQVLWWHLALTKVSLKFGILLTSPERLNDKCPFSCQWRGGFPSPS